MIPRHRTRFPVRGALPSLALLLGLAGCSAAPAPDDPNRYPTWPYPSIQVMTQYPYELTERSAVTGSWLSLTPEGHTALAEASLPNYVIALPATSEGRNLLFDMGPGSRVENVAYTEDNRILLAAAVESGPTEGSAVLTRALIEIDRFQMTLLSATPLPRDLRCRGLATTDRGWVYLYLTDSSGEGRIHALNRYNGAVFSKRRVGRVPALVGRKGVAVDDYSRFVFVLTGGQGAISDFTPVDEEETQPGLLVLGADSLQAVHTVDLLGGYEPQAVFHHPLRERVYVLASNHRGSRLYEIDAVFHYVRSVVDLPSPVSDVAFTELFAFAPATNGIYVIDLGTGGYAARPGLPFTETGEMVVLPDASLGFVRFFSHYQGGGPGIAVVNLTTGELLEVWN